MNGQYPMRPMAQAIQQHGRYGDSVLVHMNPVEVEGLASLSPTGRLTTNPVTGQPEAFLPLLAAGLGSWLGNAALGTTLGTALGSTAVGSALAGGIGSGLATAAVTGDLKRGLASGIMGAGMGAAFGAAGANAAEAASGAATGTDAALQAGVDQALTQPAAMAPDMLNATPEAIANYAAAGPTTAVGTTAAPLDTGAFSPPMSDINLTSPSAPQLSSQTFGADMSAGYAPPPITPSTTWGQQFKQGLTQPFQEGSGLAGEMMKGRTMFPIATGAGQHAQMNYDEDMAERAEELERKRRDEYARAWNNLQRGIARAQPGYAQGGIVGLANGGEVLPPDWNREVPAPGEEGRKVSDIFFDSMRPRTGLDGQSIADVTLKVNQGVPLTQAEWLIWFLDRNAKGLYGPYVPEQTPEQRAQAAAEASPENDPQYQEYYGIYQNNPKNLTYEQAHYLLSKGAVMNPQDLKEKVRKGLIQEGMILTGRGKGSKIGMLYGGRDPIEVQAGLRGDYKVAPPRDYMTGFEPEFDYFQDDPSAIQVPTRQYYPFRPGRMDVSEYFDPAMTTEDYKDMLDQYYEDIDAGEFNQPAFEPPVVPPPTTTPGPGAPPTTPTAPAPAPTPHVPAPAPGPSTQPTGPAVPGPTGGGGGFNVDFDLYKPTLHLGTGTTTFTLRDTPSGRKDPSEGTLNTDMSYVMNPDGTYSMTNMSREDSVDINKQMGEERATRVEARKAEQQPSQYTDLVAGPGFTAPTAPAPTPTAPKIAPGALNAIMAAQQAGLFNQPTTSTGNYGSLSAGPGFQAGGPVTLQSSLGETQVPGGGIANVPTPFTKPDPQQEMQMVAMAIMGQAPNPDQIIEAFIAKYGVEAFIQVRDQVLQAAAPGAQTEGLIEGAGGGMDDQVPATIGGQQPAAVSPGEYIIPADVVSGLGDGSSAAGAAELDNMMQNVRMARGGTVAQPPALDANQYMPR